MPVTEQTRKEATDIGVFDDGPAPSLSAPFLDIYNFVEKRANRVGKSIPKNRGKPGTAHPAAMLSQPEKAVLLLGRALGIPWREVRARINEEREANGQQPYPNEAYDYALRLTSRNYNIVRAIQEEVLKALETVSPLVSGTQRIVFRAKLMEFYRREIIRVMHDCDGEPDRKATNRIMALDKAMDRHMKTMDKLVGQRNIAESLDSLGDRMAEQESAKAEKEAEIEAKHEAGEISDIERVKMLRKLRNGI
jgi:hypothetical protein